MLLEGNLSSNKTKILVDKYAELLNSGVNASEILVLVQNSTLKNNFIQNTLEKLQINCFEKLQVHSFFSLVYNTISENWAFIESGNPYNNPTILPNLAGLEVSQFLLKDILKEVKFKGYNSKKSLLHQIFRRYSLIVQNNLSDDDVEWRSKILKESFSDDAKTVLKKLLQKTLFLRDFDYLRQSLIFNYVYKNTKYFEGIQYLIIDDGDEITPICFDFIKHLSSQLKDVFIAFDPKGASRAGYLSADKTAVWKFEELFNQNVQKLNSENKLNSDSEIIFTNIIEEKGDKLKHFTLQSPSKRASMLDLAINKVNELTGKNVLPCEISIITPVIDDMLKFTLKENIKNSTNLMFLSGSEKLIQNRLVLAALNILKLNTELKNSLSEFDLRVVISDFLGIPVKYCKDILENFEKDKTLIEYEFQLAEYTEKYKKFLEVIATLSISKAKFSEQVCDIFHNLAEFTCVRANEINKFNFFVKQLQDFENIFKEDFDERQTEIIIQIENSIISENPYSTLEIGFRDLVVATPQKIIDNQIKTKYQLWLDISSDEWIKSDTGPLYNAWVFQRGWSKDEYTIEDSIDLGKEKTARILRKLTLCSSDWIFTFSSLFDGNGIENFGGIENYIKYDEIKEKIADDTKAFKIIPRDDQKPVLAYKSGKMAISAVPGAGKTTILLALILKLLDNGINPENIFVMTYMDSAARNFRDRIKNIRQNSTQLPNISTIHGLALRILKENGNFERLGLSADFEICDDSQKIRIIKEIASKLKLKKTETDEFTRAISVFKIAQGEFINITDVKIKKFKVFYEEYQRILQETNLIDYDDMLLSSVRLLEENSDILAYYQETCRYIIEDEAQDSSSIQQRLINLLSGKYNNLIRCGDINQAITTTFSNADVEGFRQFIAESNSVSMDCSQRCTQDVWGLANNLILWANEKEECKNAFYKIFMRPVEGRNPSSETAIQANICKNTLEEKNYVLKEIKTALKKDPKSTIGLLLRNNYQVAQWTNFINDSGLKSITRSECLEQKSIFRTIFSVLQMILSPFDNNVIADNYETLAELGFYRQRIGSKIREYETPFIQLNCDDIENIYLAQFYWDLTYWLSFPHLAPEELAIKIGLHYYTSEIEKSNVYLISTLIKRLSINNHNFANIMERLGELSKKPSLSGFKFFSEEDESNKEFFAGKVQIMTLHKSKGDEFDYVFLPEMSEKNLTLDFELLKLKASDLMMENIKRLNSNYNHKSEFHLKQEILSESLRLMYVAITRAKSHLYFTTSLKTKSFEKIIDMQPSLIFSELLEGKARINE